MLPARCPRCIVGSVVLGVVMLLALSWFGPIGFVIILGIGLPALLALTFYWSDLETRKGRGWSRFKDDL